MVCGAAASQPRERKGGHGMCPRCQAYSACPYVCPSLLPTPLCRNVHADCHLPNCPALLMCVHMRVAFFDIHAMAQLSILHYTHLHTSPNVCPLRHCHHSEGPRHTQPARQQTCIPPNRLTPMPPLPLGGLPIATMTTLPLPACHRRSLPLPPPPHAALLPRPC